MFKHLRFNGSTVEAKSVAGEVALELLDLNDAEAVGYRTFIIELIEAHVVKKAELETAHAQLVELRENKSVSMSDVTAALTSVESSLETVNRHLARLTGR